MQKNFEKIYQKPIKIHQNSVLVTTKTEIRKKNAKQHRKNTEIIENGPQNGGPEAVIFWSSGSLFLCQTAFGAQMAAKASPNSHRISPSLDFH